MSAPYEVTLRHGWTKDYGGRNVKHVKLACVGFPRCAGLDSEIRFARKPK